ncbi:MULTISPECIES: Hsp20/alpha crystallin family protein [unclassified Cytobacillus]|uniref:Hsp20/alpha crystallin family protein n=1 Tax=unclassified Cytobacillus TaxID=2675268 RepID=UPI00203C2F63|nr:Hsp20 family protein [Cytobacillus sp. AMY 15.2]MCM3091672.1 Hsp20 family protein [Cytobacillus sp. AMY 15.2]
MNKKEELHPFNLAELEKWMEDFYLDPLSSYLDQITFRIDLYDTEAQIIVEALLTGCASKDVTVSLKEDSVIIKAAKIYDTEVSLRCQPCMRKVKLPFSVINKKVSADFANEVLEIFINKNEAGPGCNRDIIIN